MSNSRANNLFEKYKLKNGAIRDTDAQKNFSHILQKYPKDMIFQNNYGSSAKKENPPTETQRRREMQERHLRLSTTKRPFRRGVNYSRVSIRSVLLLIRSHPMSVLLLIIVGSFYFFSLSTYPQTSTATHQTSATITRATPAPASAKSQRTSSVVGCKATLTTSNDGDIEVTIREQQVNLISNVLQYKAYHPSMGKDIYMDAWRFSNIRC